MFLILSGILLLAFGVLFVIWLYTQAKNNLRATFVKEGTFVAIVAGENCSKIIMNVSGHHLTSNDEHGVVVETSDNNQAPYQPWWEKYWGFYWVSWFYPAKKVHWLTVSKHTLSTDTDARPKDRIKMTEDHPTMQLLWEIPRPVLTGIIELPGDNAGVRLLLRCIYRVHKPYIPMFIYKGKFFNLLDEAVEAALRVILQQQKMPDGKPITLLYFISEVKSGHGSDLVKGILAINDKPFGLQNVSVGIKKRLGIEVVEVWIIGHETDEKSKSLADAIMEKATQEAIGEGVKAKAEAEAEAITTIGNAEVAVTKKKAKAVKNNPEAAQVLVAEAISRIPNLTVLGPSGIIVNQPNKSANTSD